MSDTKTVDGMTYEHIGARKINSKRAATKAAEMLSTSAILWLLVKRHKVAILATGNVILVLNWAIPAWPNIVRSLF